MYEAAALMEKRGAVIRIVRNQPGHDGGEVGSIRGYRIEFDGEVLDEFAYDNDGGGGKGCGVDKDDSAEGNVRGGHRGAS